jgi:hypothetical protein
MMMTMTMMMMMTRRMTRRRMTRRRKIHQTFEREIRLEGLDALGDVVEEIRVADELAEVVVAALGFTLESSSGEARDVVGSGDEGSSIVVGIHTGAVDVAGVVA